MRGSSRPARSQRNRSAAATFGSTVNGRSNRRIASRRGTFSLLRRRVRRGSSRSS
ncbi:UNVERIFIED_CONTAM: hypothetical protein GTU68_054297, partial [Idotea baltica]|nr:hypothetical protein [Idotea baltica]